MALSKVVSGGQTGVDRGALDARSRVGSLVAVCHREVATDGVREASQSRASDSPSSGEGRMPEWPDQTKNSVKVCLTAGQVLRLLCIGGRCNLSTVRAI